MLEEKHPFYVIKRILLCVETAIKLSKLWMVFVFFFIKPAVKETQDKGRAKNGMFVAVPNSIKNQIIDVSPVFWRIQAVVLTCKHSKILIINSYFPVDKRTVNVHDVNELLETLEAIKHTIEVNEFNDILFLGDINADFLRNSNHCNQVSNFLEEFQLNKSWDNFEIDFTMCHEINEQFQVATLDHFFWNQNLEDKVLDAGVIHSPNNFSDHSPIYCFINEDIPGSSLIICSS